MGTSITDSLQAINYAINSVISLLPYDAGPEPATITAVMNGASDSREILLTPMSKFVILSKCIWSIGSSLLSWKSYCDDYQFDERMGNVSLEIITPDTGVTFANKVSWQSTGKRLQTDPNVLFNYKLVSDFEYKGNDVIPVIVKCEIMGFEQYDTTYIVPNPVRVHLSPASIAPGDTADIIIEQWDEISKTFKIADESLPLEIGVIGGCGYGNILDCAGVKSPFFNNVPQPVKFVASDSIDVDSVTATIRVRVIQRGVEVDRTQKPREGDSGNEIDFRKNTESKSEALVENKKMGNTTYKYEISQTEVSEELKPKIKQRLAELNQKSKPKSFSSEEEFCSNMEMDVFTADASVGIEGCDLHLSELNSDEILFTYELLRLKELSLWKENSSDLPHYEFACKPNSNEYITSGNSRPVAYSQLREDNQGNFNKSWIAEPYFDTKHGEENNIKFQIYKPDRSGPTPIYFDFLASICWDNIRNENITLINNLNDINNNALIPDVESAKRALKSFCGHSCYEHQLDRYLLVEVTEVHELQHMEAYRLLIDEHFPELVKKIKDYKTKCDAYGPGSLDGHEQALVDLIKDFFHERIIEWNSCSGDDNSMQREDIEKEINRSEKIKEKIMAYIDALTDRFSSLEVPKDIARVCK